ncbi:unnamed protein product [Phytophthora lilii]|uniref:endo-1,4-beta-xylanase n=1 Tax=Phytophthora lilii TaxID=2077276 RepID=A0A9W6TDS4_9STRA|nr:unnamed protein product [Phytophthora lilii]
MLKALENHITKVMTHFGNFCYAWDVANEVMGDNAQMRESFWYTTTGMEFLQTAFKTANSVKKSLGLKTKLYYNDYNTNTINAKSTAVLNMVKGLLDDGITVDGVGFQSHFGHADPATAADQAANFERFTALGLDVALTELDVTASSSSPSEEEQAQQGNVYKNTIAACKQVKRCVGVTIWGYDDNYSWLSTKAPLPWYQPGGAGSALVRKSLYDSIVEGWGGSNGSSAQTSGSATSTGSESSGTGQSTSQTTGTDSSIAQTTGGSIDQSFGSGTGTSTTPVATSPASDSATQAPVIEAGSTASAGSRAKCTGRRLRK